MTPANFVVLNRTDNSIFFDRNCSVEVNESLVTRYASSQKIETLIQELQEKGPLVALGQIGPAAYSAAPFQLQNPVYGQTVYGWKPKTPRLSESQYLMVLGAVKEGERGLVYMTLSKDVTTNSKSTIRTHLPSSTDKKIYVISHKTFENYLTDLYPPRASVANVPHARVEGVHSEQMFLEKLSALMPLDSILDQGEGEKKCKAIGQDIFDHFKAKAGGNSDAGRETVIYICNAIENFAKDGKLRKQYIEHAWNGIGDNQWQWRA